MGRTETVKLLLDKGADINKGDTNGKTALMWAAHYGRFQVVELLLKSGADVKAKDNKDHTALWWTGKIRTKIYKEKTREALLRAETVAEESK